METRDLWCLIDTFCIYIRWSIGLVSGDVSKWNFFAILKGCLCIDMSVSLCICMCVLIYWTWEQLALLLIYWTWKQLALFVSIMISKFKYKNLKIRGTQKHKRKKVKSMMVVIAYIWVSLWWFNFETTSLSPWDKGKVCAHSTLLDPPVKLYWVCCCCTTVLNQFVATDVESLLPNSWHLDNLLLKLKNVWMKRKSWSW